MTDCSPGGGRVAGGAASAASGGAAGGGPAVTFISESAQSDGYLRGEWTVKETLGKVPASQSRIWERRLPV